MHGRCKGVGLINRMVSIRDYVIPKLKNCLFKDFVSRRDFVNGYLGFKPISNVTLNNTFSNLLYSYNKMARAHFSLLSSPSSLIKPKGLNLFLANLGFVITQCVECSLLSFNKLILKLAIAVVTNCLMYHIFLFFFKNLT